MSDIKYPDVLVQLSGEDGNAFAVIGRCIEAARRGGVSSQELDTFKDEVSSGDYYNVLQTCMKWFNIK